MERVAAVAETLAGRSVLVVGMGRSGRAAAELLRDRGARVTCTDQRADAPRVEGCAAIYGEHRVEDFTGAELVVLSPGVPGAIPELEAARAAGVPVVGELGLAAALLPPELPVLAVTGTNGKSSTTHFLGQFLEQADRKPFVGGNIGRPLSELVRALDGGEAFDVAVVEVSSYQLEAAGPFAPLAGAILNLTPDHLVRHGDMDGYAAAKFRLFEHVGPDGFALLPAGAAWALRRLEGLRARVLWLSGRPGIREEDGELVLSGTPDDGRLSLDGLCLPGRHNRSNVAAAVLLAVSAGVPRSALKPALLRPLAHRLEPVAQGGGISWVNDSKATNIDAALAGITGVGEGCDDGSTKPLVVLLGGAGKAGADYALLHPALARYASDVVCFGAAGGEIARALEGLPVSRAAGLANAVEVAARLARPGQVVLLSPACASFDEFRDFEQRGEAFARLARAHTGENP